MDGYFDGQGQPKGSRAAGVSKTEGLATAALILGIIAAMGFAFVLPPFVFGATAIVLGLLSSGRDGIALRAKIGMFMGALSMVFLIVIMISAVHLIMSNPDILEEFRQYYNEIYQELESEGFLNGSFT